MKLWQESKPCVDVDSSGSDLFYIVLIVTILSYLSLITQGTLLSENVLGVNCSADSSVCFSSHSLCLPLPSGSFQCVCDTHNGFFLDNETCVYRAEVNEFCLPGRSVCRDRWAVCDYTVGEHSLARCQCSNGSISVYANGRYKCGVLLDPTRVPDCLQCVNNNGLCYDTSGNGTRDGCLCPPPYSGTNCETPHVKVACSARSMDVCYTPQDGFNFSAGSWLHADWSGDLSLCHARQDSARCGPGNWLLNVSLSQAVCGTRRIVSPDGSKVTFSSDLVVQKFGYQTTTEDLYFSVFCTFTQLVTASANVRVDSVVGSSVGLQVLPNLLLSVKNMLLQTVQANQVLVTGDRVYFNIYLNPNNGYGALRVEFCTISSSGSGYSQYPGTSALLVIDSGCAAVNQDYFSAENLWRPFNGLPYELQSGLVKVIPLQSANALFLQCTLKLCVKGYEADCAPVNCSGAKSRARRSDPPRDVTSKFTAVQIEMRLGQRQDAPNAQSLVVPWLAGFLLPAAVLGAVVFFITHRFRRKQKERSGRPTRVFVIHSSYQRMKDSVSTTV